jgi:TrmH family RNA methyltransferase
MPDALFRDISGLESPAGMAFVWDMPAAPALNGGAATVVLDRVQDAGNVGSILRSASAFGFRQVVALKGSAALWSGKVLRAGMGAHFALNLIEGAGEEVLDALDVPLLVTSSHAGGYLHQMELPWPCAWVMGHEGQGVAASIEARAAQRVRIAQPGGEESLNVAAAAAICLHASGAVR